MLQYLIKYETNIWPDHWTYYVKHNLHVFSNVALYTSFLLSHLAWEFCHVMYVTTNVTRVDLKKTFAFSIHDSVLNNFFLLNNACFPEKSLVLGTSWMLVYVLIVISNAFLLCWVLKTIWIWQKFEIYAIRLLLHCTVYH